MQDLRGKSKVDASSDPGEQVTPAKFTLDRAKSSQGQARDNGCITEKCEGLIEQIRKRVQADIWAPHLPVMKAELCPNRCTIGLNLDLTCKVAYLHVIPDCRLHLHSN